LIKSCLGLKLHLVAYSAQANHALMQESSRLALLKPLLKRAKSYVSNLSVSACLCQQFGLQAETNNIPIATISAQQDLSPEIFESHPHWMLAHPIHLVLQRDAFSIQLLSPVPTDESVQVLALLNQHFSQDGLHWAMGQSGAWYLGLQHALDIQALPVESIANQSLKQVIPQGLDHHRWRSLSNEIQMLLFEHSINSQREARGEFAINSVWLSGGGALPSVTPFVGRVFSPLPLVRGMAQQAVWPITQTSLLASAQCLVAVQHLEDISEQEWEAILEAIQHGKIKQFHFTLGNGAQTLNFELNAWDKFKFWRNSLEKLPLALDDLG
jgi:hypothetical protein